ncbi:hypothetical protein Bca52824_001233 [Brassica carinata]|uniref:Uncharacterized protein n=1 Tax=Brassica carinata TaxID=52824 RepID=A0A8X8BD56_BRACI|nr:hypothetical protein Bca52824_001233 [Brassica carinata]
MANALVFLSDLQNGRSSSTVQVHLLHFWEARNDPVATMMPATINVNRLATYRPNLRAGLVYSLTGLFLANPFSNSNSFKEVTDPAVPIPPESFRFRNHSEMLGLANTNNQLPDLIGEITAVKRTVTEPPQEKNRVIATIKMDNVHLTVLISHVISDTLVTMSLFDAQAVNIHNQLEKMRGDPRVVVATSVNPKMYNGVHNINSFPHAGHLFLNATPGTYIYFDKETSAGEIFFNGLVEQDTGVTPAALLLRGYAKLEALSIAELNNFFITALRTLILSVMGE